MCFWKILGAGGEWITGEQDWRQEDQEGNCLDLQEEEDEVLAQSRETRGPRETQHSRGVPDATGAQERAPKLRSAQLCWGSQGQHDTRSAF